MTRPQASERETVDCFDPHLAEHETRTVRVDEVMDLLEVTHAPDVIEAYRRAMRAGDRFPPICVVRLAGRLFIADGHKRFQAFCALGGEEITVELWPKRRWLADQWGQLRRKTRAQGSLLIRMPRDAAARAAARRLFWDTVGHWGRVVLSLRRFIGRTKGLPTDGRG
jgi:hypothetical protein